MGLLTTKRRPEIERESLTRTIDAAFAFVEGSAQLSGEFVQDMFLALGVVAERLGASMDVRRSITDGLAFAADRPMVPARAVIDRLLDIRSLAVSCPERSAPVAS